MRCFVSSTAEGYFLPQWGVVGGDLSRHIVRLFSEAQAPRHGPAGGLETPS